MLHCHSLSFLLACRYLAHQVTASQLMIAMEYAPDGDLATMLKAQRGPLAVMDALRIMRDVFAGVAYLHNVCKLVHRDIKLENILMSGGRPLLGDLGLGKDISSASVRSIGRTLTHAM